MPPNYDLSLNPSKILHVEKVEEGSSLASIIQASFMYRSFFWVLEHSFIIPLLVLSFWSQFHIDVFRGIVVNSVKVPRKVSRAIVFVIFGSIASKSLDQATPVLDEQHESITTDSDTQASGFAGRVYVLVSNTSSIYSRIHSFLCYKQHDFLRIPLHAEYITDRYVIHSPFCYLKRFGNKPSRYTFKGVYLSRNEGFKDYVAKCEMSAIDPETNQSDGLWDIQQGSEDLSGEISEHSSQEPSPAPASPVPDTIDNVSAIPESSLKNDLPKENSMTAQLQVTKSGCPFLGKSPVPQNVLQAQSSSTTTSLSHISNFEKPSASKMVSPQSSLKTISDKIVNVKVNGKELKLKISRKPKGLSLFSPPTTKTFYPSISESETQYLEAVKQEIKQVLPLAEYDDGSLAPIVFRLAWHSCATYDKYTNTGGSNGSTMRFVPEITDDGNTGLEVARSALERVKQRYPKITYSDLWTFAGCVALEEMQGPKIVWKPGRYDCKDTTFVPPNGRLPFGYKDSDHIRQTFTRMGFDDQETVALLGAHGLGRCHKKFSGWEGKWTSEPLVFDNEFFKILIDEEWIPGVVPETGREQYYNLDKSLMMLNTDLELVRDERYKVWVQKYAEDEELFRSDFAKSFAKLLELGIERDEKGNVKQREK